MAEAARAIGAWSRKRDILTLALVILALLAITVGDNIVYPGHNLTILYVIPVLVAALRTTPCEVLGVAVGSLILDGYESLLHNDFYHGWPIRTAALVVVYGFAVFIASQRKQLAARSRALEVANARANAILDNAANAILFVEPGQDRLTANATARRLLAGASGQEFGIATAMGELTNPDGSSLAPAEWPSRLALAGMPTNNVEFVVKGPNGRSTPVLVSAAPVIGAGGTIIGAVIVAQDITVVKELEREREEWISIVAHDLRQPITTIAGYAQLLARQAEPGALQLRKSVENIAVSARQLNRMIADLLDVSRIDAVHLTLEKQMIDLLGFLRGATERVGEALPDHRIDLKVAANLPLVEADPGRLEQVLTNLLTNAAKYGDRNAAIQVTAQRRDDGVEIAVTNRGPGIPAESLPHLFDRFYRGRRARESKVGGLGVGLYITNGLVAAHGGKLRVASAPGEETTFAFTLPATAEAGGLPDPQPLPVATGRGWGLRSHSRPDLR